MKCYSIQYKNQDAKPVIERTQKWDQLFVETTPVSSFEAADYVYRPHDICVSKPFLLRYDLPFRRHDEMRLSSFCSVRTLTSDGKKTFSLDVSTTKQVSNLIFDNAIFVKDDVLGFLVEIDEARNSANLYCEHSLIEVSLFLARIDSDSIPGRLYSVL